MAKILKTSDFVGKFAIGQFTLNEQLLQWYIDQCEQNFFKKYCSEGYYDDLLQRLESEDIAVKNAAIAELAEFKDCVVAYVWLEYASNEQEKMTGAGITLQGEQNSQTVNMDIKCMRVFNDMVAAIRELRNPNFCKKNARYRNFLGI